MSFLGAPSFFFYWIRYIVFVCIRDTVFFCWFCNTSFVGIRMPVCCVGLGILFVFLGLDFLLIFYVLLIKGYFFVLLIMGHNFRIHR